MKTSKMIGRLSLSFLFLAMLFIAGSASADPWHTGIDNLGYAVPDECYAGMGVDYPGGITPGDGYTAPYSCPDTTPNPNYDPADPESPMDLQVLPKTNDSYVWALTDEGDSLWFASAANVMCTTAGVFLGALTQGETDIRLLRSSVYVNHAYDADGEPMYDTTVFPPEAICEDEGGFSEPCGAELCRDAERNTGACDGVFTNPVRESYRIPYNVCEHEESQVAREGTVMGETGDWRPSKVFRYNKNTAGLTNLTEQIYAAGDAAVFGDILGIRCAGSHNGVVFFAGGNQSYTGVTMFAFRASDGQYLGYNTYTAYRQIRKMIVVNNRLYTGVAGSSGQGQVLHWRGSVTNPFSWQTVGRVQGSITELSGYVDGNGQTRIVANSAGGLYVSPAMFWGRLFWWHAWGWQNVWSASMYEPDTYSAFTYGPGAVAQLGEWMYWGTMHIPYHTAYMNAQFRFGGFENVPEHLEYGLYYGTTRATTIWRGRNLGQAGQEIQLVYGEKYLGAWDDNAPANLYYPADPETPPGNFVPVDTGWEPLNMAPEGYLHPLFQTQMGSSGFFNPNNNYSWTALAFSDETGDHLFFGTMDQTLIGDTEVDDMYPDYVMPPDPGGYPGANERGADLWRFSLNDTLGGATDTEAVAEFTNGAGNPYQYGVRTLIASDDGIKIYIGMANNGSLMYPGIVPNLDFNGGWELHELVRNGAPE